VQGRLLRASEAGAVSAREGLVGALVEQDRLELANALLEAADARPGARPRRQGTRLRPAAPQGAAAR